ncbi:hypothetical protein [Flavobacterium sp.]|jgi:arginyl-tRNA synthetase|uniref:hypothetical protein n=1 Tax=Flavobacterium sp. TaxID=239 RepID=UPI0037C16B1C
MTTYTITIDEKTEVGKAFRKMLDKFRKEPTAIEIREEMDSNENEMYNPEFVKKILERVEASNNLEERKNWKTINPDDIWGSIL